MSTITKEFTKEQLIEQGREVVENIGFTMKAYPGGATDSARMNQELIKIAPASLEADGSPANEGTITATLFKPVADLYEVTVPGGRSTTFTKDAAEASDCRVMGWSVQEYVRLERYQAAMLQGAENSESRCTIQTAPALDSSPKNAESRCSNSTVIPDGICHYCGRKPLKNKMCSVAGCDGKHVARGFCVKHYAIERKKDPSRRESIRAADKRYRARKAAAPQQEAE